jgi:hypothetical protein
LISSLLNSSHMCVARSAVRWGQWSPVPMMRSRRASGAPTKDDQKRKTASARKSSIRGKGMRKKAKAARKKRDAPTAGEGGASYGANSAMDDVPLGAEEEEVVCGDEPPVAARAARKCGLCGMPGHTRRTCSQAAPAPAAQEEGEEAVEEGEK